MMKLALVSSTMGGDMAENNPAMGGLMFMLMNKKEDEQPSKKKDEQPSQKSDE